LSIDQRSAAQRRLSAAKTLNTFAEFERDLLIERTQAGLKRAKAAGKIFGRPDVLTDEQRDTAGQKLASGASVSEVARLMKASRQTITRARAVRDMATA
jgi:putative DNA-invertase from lambdoid prophage Rac